MKKILLLAIVLLVCANVNALDKYTYTEGTYNIEEPIKTLVIEDLTFNNVERGIIQDRDNYNIIVSESGHQNLNLNNIHLEFYGKADITKTADTFRIMGDIEIEIDRNIGQHIKLNALGYLKIFPDSSIEVENGQATFLINTFLTNISPSFILSSNKEICTLKKDSTYEVNNYLITALNPNLKIFSETSPEGDYFVSISHGDLEEAKGNHLIKYNSDSSFEVFTEAGTSLYFKPSSNSPLTIKTHNPENKEYFTITNGEKEFKVVNQENIGHLKIKKSKLNLIEESAPFIIIPLNANNSEEYANYISKSGKIETIDSEKKSVPLVQVLGIGDVNVLIYNSITNEPVGKLNKVFFDCEPVIFVDKENGFEKRLTLVTTNCTSSADKSVEMDCIKMIEHSNEQEFLDCKDTSYPMEVIATIPISQKDFAGNFLDIGKPIYKDDEKRAIYKNFLPERLTTNKGRASLELFRIRVDSTDIIPLSYYVKDETVFNYIIIKTMREKLKQGLYSSHIWVDSEEINEEALRELVPGIRKQELINALKWAVETSKLFDENEKPEFYNFLTYLSKPKENIKITGGLVSYSDIKVSIQSFLSRLNLFPALRKKTNTANPSDSCDYVDQCKGSDYGNCYVCKSNKCIASTSNQNYYDRCEKNCQCKRINYYDDSEQAYNYYPNLLCMGNRCVQRDTVLNGLLPQEDGVRCSAAQRNNFEEIFKEHWNFVYDISKEYDIDPALVFAIAEQETCLGQESDRITGIDGLTGWNAQIEATVKLLHNAFYKGSGAYSSCKKYPSIEEKWMCIFCTYGPEPNDLRLPESELALPIEERDVCYTDDPLNPKWRYPVKIYSFWNEWKLLIYKELS